MCTANFLLVSTVVMQFVALSEQSSSVMPSSEALSFFNIAYMLGLFIPGPVGAFLVDKYRRQNVYRVSLIAMVVATALMYFDKSVEVVALVRFLEGMMFGLGVVGLDSRSVRSRLGVFPDGRIQFQRDVALRYCNAGGVCSAGFQPESSFPCSNPPGYLRA